MTSGPPPTARTLEELRQAIDDLAPIVGTGLTGRLILAVAEQGPQCITTREATSILTAQLAVFAQFGEAKAR
jgi:hypothetical protein